MSPFRRRRREEEDEPVDLAPEEPAAVESAPERPRTTGPWDVDDAPEDELPRLDLGALRVPVPDGAELRLEVDEQSQTVIAAVAVLGPNAIQIGAFAAPRSAGIWDEVADEITQGLRAAGGGSEPADGPFGRELKARVPMETPNGGRRVAPARFLGVDGPRWFLRGMVQGPAATDPVQARALEDIFRGVVVVRGTEAMAPRDPLPLQVPRDVADQIQGAQHDHGHDHEHDHDHEHHHEPAAEAAPQFGDLNPFERGPEITEIR